jgi:hypothetical protein
MTGMRKGDTRPYTKFRPGRFFKEAGKWYFQTREGSTEGPFGHRFEAQSGLDAYLLIFRDLQLQGFNPGIYSSARTPALEPIQMQWR